MRPFSAHLLSQLFQPPFPLLFASIVTEVHPVYFRLSLPICLRLNDLHSSSPPAVQETDRQMINAMQTFPGLGTRYTVSLDRVGRHPKSHQPRLSYAAACKSGLKRGHRGAGHGTSMGNPAARAVVLPWDFTQLWQLRNPYLPHRQTGPSCQSHHSAVLPWEILRIAGVSPLLEWAWHSAGPCRMFVAAC